MPKPSKERFNTQVIPEPALEKRTRRQFKPEYKLRIIAEANAGLSEDAPVQYYGICLTDK